jgi:NADH-quinone oxidoreductase subunit J
MMIQVLFGIFAALCIGSALMVVTRRNPVNAGVWLLLTFVSMAAMYILLNAQFIAVIQITIYAGAILILVLFVIMLLNLRTPGRKLTELLFGTRQGIAAIVFVGLFALELATILFLKVSRFGEATGLYSNEKIAEDGAIQSLSEALFSTYLLPFEVASFLLLAAIIGAVVMTRKAENSEQEGGTSE